MPRALLIALYFLLASVSSGIIFIWGFVTFGQIISRAEIGGIGLVILLAWFSIIVGFIGAYLVLLKKFRSPATSPSPFWLSFVLHSLVVFVLYGLLASFVGYLPIGKIALTLADSLFLAGLTYLIGRTMMRSQGSFFGALALGLISDSILWPSLKPLLPITDSSLILFLNSAIPVLLAIAGYYLAKRFWPKLI